MVNLLSIDPGRGVRGQPSPIMPDLTRNFRLTKTGVGVLPFVSFCVAIRKKQFARIAVIRAGKINPAGGIHADAKRGII